MRFKGRLLLGAASTAITLAPAHAQSDAGVSDMRGNGEIVVTARKRSEALLDVPLPVTALPQEILRNADVTSPAEAILLTPTGGVVTTDSGVTQRFQLRGIGSAQGVTIGEPGVAVYVDEVYASGIRTNYPDFFDLDRIEVLRGPQGALFGRNAVGGAINILTAAPDPARLSSRVELRYGELERVEARAAINVPVSSAIAARATGWYVNQDKGEFYNPALNAFTDRQRVYGGRFALGGTSGDLRWRALVEGGRRDGPSNVVYAPIRETPLTAARNAPDRIRADDFRLTLQAFYDTGIGEAALIYGYKDYDLRLSSDDDFTALVVPNTNADQRQPDTREEVTSHYVEARLVGDSGAIRYLFGLNFYSERFGQDGRNVTVDAGGTAAPLSCNVLLAFPAAPGGFAPVPVQAINPAFPLFTNCSGVTTRTNRQGTDSFAAFGELTYAVTSQLDITGSVRWTRDDKTIRYSQTSSALYAPFFPTASFSGDAKFSKLTPAVTVSWRPTDTTQLYAKYNQGFRAGGFNLTLLAGGQLAYGQENFENFEAGGKVEFFDGRLLLSATAYRLQQSDLVVPTLVLNPVTGTAIGTTLANAGRGRTDGLEFEARARIANTLFLSAGIGLLDPKFRSGSSAGTPLAGSDLPGVGKRSGYVLGTWTPRIADDVRGELTVNYRFRSGGLFQIGTTDRLAPFDQIDLSAGITFGQVNVVAFVDNLGDQRYRNNSVQTFSGLTLVGLSPGRRVGGRVNFNF